MIKNILLAEDDRVTALLVKTQLEKNNYWVFTASNGVEALKLLAVQRFDLIITDVVMPKMDGVDLYAAVKKNPETTNIPIIIVTDKAVFKESFASLGVSNFVEKTTNINVLLDKISSIQKDSNDAKKYPKILITGSHQNVLNQMSTVLKGLRYLVVSADSSESILAKTLEMKPHAIIMDVLFQDQASTYELIGALRRFSFLAGTKIITYSYFQDGLGMDVEGIESLKESIDLCSKAGSDFYIGRFNQAFLLEKLTALGI